MSGMGGHVQPVARTLSQSQGVSGVILHASLSHMSPVNYNVHLSSLSSIAFDLLLGLPP